MEPRQTLEDVPCEDVSRKHAEKELLLAAKGIFHSCLSPAIGLWKGCGHAKKADMLARVSLD